MAFAVLLDFHARRFEYQAAFGHEDLATEGGQLFLIVVF